MVSFEVRMPQLKTNQGSTKLAGRHIEDAIPGTIGRREAVAGVARGGVGKYLQEGIQGINCTIRYWVNLSKQKRLNRVS